MPEKPGKTIYDLALHETMEVGKHYQDHMFATRVPGGWVYREGKAPGTFVPYSPEFKFADRPSENERVMSGKLRLWPSRGATNLPQWLNAV
jgi:hypothetical protein